MKLINAIHQYDLWMFIWLMNRKRLPWFTRIGRWLSWTGDGYLYVGLAGLLILLGTPESRLFLYCALTGFAVERPCYFMLKNGLRRHRPQEALAGFRSFVIPSDRFSFPSGHTSAAFLMASLLGVFYPAVAIPAFIWATSVGLSRIFLGVHFPTDVLVGMTLGMSLAKLALWIVAA